MLADVIRLSRRLKEGELEPSHWQYGVAQLLSRVSVSELVSLVGPQSRLRGVARAKLGATVVRLDPTEIAAVDPPAGLACKLFAFEEGRANPPHSHDNMVSVHLVLSGEFHVRHFDRVEDRGATLDLRPTLDRELGPGGFTSISDARDNVHWHVAQSPGVLLDILVAGVGGETRTQLLDPDGGARLRGGLIRAPKLATVEEALAKYGQRSLLSSRAIGDHGPG